MINLRVYPRTNAKSAEEDLMAVDLSSSLDWKEINNINRPTNRGISAVEDFEVSRTVIPNTIRNRPTYRGNLISIFMLYRLLMK